MKLPPATSSLTVYCEAAKARLPGRSSSWIVKDAVQVAAVAPPHRMPAFTAPLSVMSSARRPSRSPLLMMGTWNVLFVSPAANVSTPETGPGTPDVP